MNTTEILTLIGCATLVAIVAIICDFVVEKSSSDTTENKLSQKIIRIHRNYITWILGFALIVLFTAKIGGSNNGLYDYLSFGSTITSLVLSILAIFVTVRSSMDLNKQFGTINEVSNLIGQSLRNLQAAETKIGETSSHISSQMDSIVDKVVERFNNRFDKNEEYLSKLLTESSPNIRSLMEHQSDNHFQIDTSAFISRTSLHGLFAIYICVLSKEKDMPFVLFDLFKDQDLQSYIYGHVVAVIATGLLLFDNYQIQQSVKCTMHSFNKAELVEELKERIRTKEPERQHNHNLALINHINSYFNEPLFE